MKRMSRAARWLWTQLTSMKTALLLLFLLALAAIPGSIVPQRDSNPIQVADYQASHPTLNRVFEPLGMYHVYTSPWFSAIYLLLFISLLGCIIPRISTFARQLRSQPPRVPRRLDRLPVFAEVTLPDADAAAGVVARGERWLRTQHFRVVRDEVGVRAEKGYLREAGNLLFHLALVVLLIGVAVNGLFSQKGTAVVVEGQSFTNNITQYDDFSAGAAVNTDDLTPFTLKLNDFRVEFESGPVQTGAARLFEAHVTVDDGQASRDETLEVNHPVHVDGQVVHLLGHGYAPLVTIIDANGNTAYSGPSVFLPQDQNFASNGVVKAPDARPERIALEGLFLPTAVIDQLGPRSAFPDALNPELVLTGYVGEPKTETGRPENIYSLDTTGMTQLTVDGTPWSVALKPGESAELPGGAGTVIFQGYQRWVKLQVSRSPGLALIGGSIAAAIIGLCASLFVRPRRVWIKQSSGEDGVVVQFAGLDRLGGRTGLDDEVAQLRTAAVGKEPA